MSTFDPTGPLPDKKEPPTPPHGYKLVDAKIANTNPHWRRAILYRISDDISVMCPAHVWLSGHGLAYGTNSTYLHAIPI